MINVVYFDSMRIFARYIIALFVLGLCSMDLALAQVNEPDADKALAPTEEWVRLTPHEYIYRWRATAVENMEVYGIPASITMGQAILESGYGNGYLARVANNHFCIKCKKSWTGRTITHSDDNPDDCFRVYDSAEASFEDHADFLSSGQRYEFLFAYDTDDYKNWAKGLKQAGYATAPDYAERLIGVIERYHLYLLDGENGIAHYDAFLANELSLDTAALAERVGIQLQEEPVVEDVESPAIEELALPYSGGGIDPDNFRVTINSHHGYNVYRTNGAYYIIARDGDTFESLGRLFELSPAMLRKFNDLKRGAQPVAGDVVYIERKAQKWMGTELLHVVCEGETMYGLAQMYGVRLRSLTRLNKGHVAESLIAGQTVRLR